MAKKFMAPFMGTHLYTDDGDLLAYLKSDHYNQSDFHTKFPGIFEAVNFAIGDLEAKGKRTINIVYVNGYAQAWPQKGEPGKAFRNPYLPTDL